MKFLLLVKTLEGDFHGGFIKSNNVDDSDIAAFFIWKALESEGFEILSVETIDPNHTGYDAIKDRDLSFYLAYYKMQYSKYSEKYVDKIIEFFEQKEDYEKCGEILKYKRLMFEPQLV